MAVAVEIAVAVAAAAVADHTFASAAVALVRSHKKHGLQQRQLIAISWNPRDQGRVSGRARRRLRCLADGGGAGFAASSQRKQG